MSEYNFKLFGGQGEDGTLHFNSNQDKCIHQDFTPVFYHPLKNTLFQENSDLYIRQGGYVEFNQAEGNFKILNDQLSQLSVANNLSAQNFDSKNIFGIFDEEISGENSISLTFNNSEIQMQQSGGGLKNLDAQKEMPKIKNPAVPEITENIQSESSKALPKCGKIGSTAEDDLDIIDKSRKLDVGRQFSNSLLESTKAGEPSEFNEKLQNSGETKSRKYSSPQKVDVETINHVFKIDKIKKKKNNLLVVHRKGITQCKHTNSEYYAKGMGKNGYHRKAKKSKNATDGEHKWRSHYAKGLGKCGYHFLYKNKVIKNVHRFLEDPDEYYNL